MTSVHIFFYPLGKGDIKVKYNSLKNFINFNQILM